MLLKKDILIYSNGRICLNIAANQVEFLLKPVPNLRIKYEFILLFNMDIGRSLILPKS